MLASTLSVKPDAVAMNMSMRSDRTLAELSFDDARLRALDGDGDAFTWFFRRYAGRVRGFAVARGVDDPDGVTNDVMLRVFQQLNTFSGNEAAFVRWLFTIARNRIIDVYRSGQRRPIIVDEQIPDRAVASAEQGALDRMSIIDVRDRLAVLTDDQREVISLRLVEDLSLNDVAEIMGRPVTAVKALQRRGLDSLRRQFAIEGEST